MSIKPGKKFVEMQHLSWRGPLIPAYKPPKLLWTIHPLNAVSKLYMFNYYVYTRFSQEKYVLSAKRIGKTVVIWPANGTINF